MLPKRAKLFEFFLAVAVIGACIHFLQSALLRVEEDAERMIVEATIRNINAGVRMAQAQLIIQGKDAEVAALFAGTPARWLVRPPEGFVEVDRLDASPILPGQWVWERQREVLHYRPRLSAGLVAGGEDVIRWHWVVPGRSAQRAGLQPVQAYNWAVG